MYKHIMLPTDGSELSDKAVRDGIAFARDAGGKVTVLTCYEPFAVIAFSPAQLEYTQDNYLRAAREQGQKALDAAAAIAAQAGVPCETVLVEDAQPHRAIIDAAKARGCDLILMASHGRRGLSAIVLGSETLKVLTHSPIPVLVQKFGQAR